MNFVMKQALGGKINSFYSVHAHTNVTFYTRGRKSHGWNCRSVNLHMSLMSFQVEEVTLFSIPLLPLTFSYIYSESLRSHAAALLRTLALREANRADLTVTNWLFVA